jgi:hypothetical protein
MAVGLVACSHSKPSMPDAFHDPAGYTAAVLQQKTVVVCLQGNQPTNQFLETYMANHLKKDGFQTFGTKEIFKIRKIYTPLMLLDDLNRAGIKGLIEVTFSGKVTKEGVPENYTIHYRSLNIKKKDVVNNKYDSMTGALVQLLMALPFAAK